MEATAAAGYLDRTEWCDVDLIATSGDVHPANWLALASRLEYFENMWSSGMKEKNEGKVNVAASSEVIKFVLDWVYAECVPDKSDLNVLIQTIKLAHLWDSADLATAAHDGTTSVKLAEMSLWELLGWSLSCGLLRPSVKYAEKLKDLYQAPKFPPIPEICEMLRKNEVPEVGVWGVKIFCLALKMKQAPTKDSSDVPQAAPRRPNFDITPHHDLCLVSREGSKHVTCRQFFPKRLTAAKEQEKGSKVMMEMAIDSCGETASMLVKMLNGEELQTVSVEEFTSLYFSAQSMELTRVMRSMQSRVCKAFRQCADMTKLLEWSSNVPHTDLGLVILGQRQITIAPTLGYQQQNEKSQPTTAAGAAVRLVIALLVEGAEYAKGTVRVRLTFQSAAMEGGSALLQNGWTEEVQWVGF